MLNKLEVHPAFVQLTSQRKCEFSGDMSTYHIYKSGVAAPTGIRACDDPILVDPQLTR